MSALCQSVEIRNKRGLHARASARFVTLASSHPALIEVEKDGSRVVGTSIMGLMMLGAAIGDTITISASGEGADTALAALVALVDDKFGEE
ncbi:HPr family phosphocarrier protein [Aquisediminimonas sediminicola]|uniref:HPr family phosphocarrier protein n=1 Tax=Alteraquisediminimonas sediminicola TaxID=2676787 RepID=UPI001C8D9A39|nr:HPr family phosphocarrier protein [Aquisediminimonas sediminicola]